MRPPFLGNHVCSSPVDKPGASNTKTVKKLTKADIEAIMEDGKGYLKPLQERSFFLDNQGCLCLTSNINRWDRQIDADNVWNKENTVRRELVSRIKRAKDPILANDGHIRLLESIILFYAGTLKHRKSLLSLRDKYSDLLEDVGNENIKFEAQAKGFYDDFISLLKPSSKILDTIAALSWSNEPEYYQRSYLCYTWVISTCIIDMIDLEKE